MNKKVLVIDTDNNAELADFVYQIHDMTLAQAKVFIENSSSPGDLLAEFKAEIIDCGSMGKAIGATDEDMEVLEGGKKYTVLILTSTDKGSEVKK